MTSLQDALAVPPRGDDPSVPQLNDADLKLPPDQKQAANTNQPKSEADIVNKGMESIKGDLAGVPKPPEMIQYAKAPEAQTSDAVQQGYVSAIGIMGAIGSAFTRRPMVNAMNSAAAVVKSMKEGDQEAFKQNMEKWKIDNENIKNMNDYQQQAYKSILENTKLSIETKMGMMTARAAAFNDPIVQKLAQDRNDIQLKDIMERRDEADKNYQLKKDAADQAVTEAHDKNQLYQEGVEAHPEWTPEQKAMFRAKVFDPSVAAASIRADAATQKAADKSKAAYQEASSMIDDLIAKAQKGGGIGVTGIAGFAERVGETIATTIPGTQNVKTPASDFESQLDTVKLELPKLLTGTSKSAADERAEVSKILRGLGPGDTQQRTVNALEQVKEIFAKRSGEEKEEEKDTGSQYSIGDVVTAPDGTKKKITGFDGDGTPLGETVP